jgi:hypothetical protein
MSGKLMSEKYPGAAASYEPAMTFEEIGRELGIPKQAVYFLFVSALKKLRRRSATKQFAELVEMRTCIRDRVSSLLGGGRL